jgi:hypothetical protein
MYTGLCPCEGGEGRPGVPRAEEAPQNGLVATEIGWASHPAVVIHFFIPLPWERA